jgi:NAD(P) transhydrogenase subunit alpha
MNAALLAEIYIFVLAVFVGFEVISKVPVVLHTPLMSGTNAIHGIVMLGGILVLAEAHEPLLVWLGFAAVVLGAINLFGGFVVTDRMLEMFKSRKPGGRKA